MQKDLHKLGYILKEIMLECFHIFIQFKTTKPLCHGLG